MELKMKNIRTGFLTLLVAITLGSMFHGCSTQRGLATTTRQDTIVIPKKYRPSQLQVAQQQNKDLQKQISPLQKQLQQDLPDVLTRSKKAFGEISDIKGMLTYMNENSLAERDFLFGKAVEIRGLNDSLTRSMIRVNKSNETLIGLVLAERDARIAREKKNDIEKQQNDAYKESTIWYATGAFGILVLLSVISLVISVLNYLKSKELKALNHV